MEYDWFRINVLGINYELRVLQVARAGPVVHHPQPLDFGLRGQQVRPNTKEHV